MEQFASNLDRLLGLHRMTQTEVEQIIHISQSSLSKWRSGDRSPSFKLALMVGQFFGVPADRIATATFDDLLANELADPERFKVVEEKIARERRKAARRMKVV